MPDVRDFLLPDLGEGLEDAEVVSWRVAEGDAVELNQVLVEVNTAKALVEIPSPWAGVVARLHAAAGDVVLVGSPLVSITVGDGESLEGPHSALESAAEVAPGSALESVESGSTRRDLSEERPAGPRRRAVLVGYGVEEEEPSASSPSAPSAAGASSGRGGPVAATPPVRRLAKELGVDLAAVAGSGPEGRVTREDVVQAAERGTIEPSAPREGTEDVTRVPVRGTRRLIAERMARSVREIPQVTTFLTVDCATLLAFRDHLSETGGERISPLAIIVAALVRTIEDHPKLNASFDADADGGPEIALHGRRHVGIATDTDRGLLVPVVRDADRLGISALAGEIRRLAAAAREGRATPIELTGSTITVSNVGTFGAESGTPIINHPEGAILAVGVIEPRAMVVDGRVQARPATTLSLTFDHRLTDGAEAGRALRALKDRLENPFELGRLAR